MIDPLSIPPAGHDAAGAVNRGLSAGRLNGAAHVNGAAKPHAIIEPATDLDRVELSNVARWLDELRHMPSVREQRITQIRSAIENGTYDVEARLDEALDRLLEEELL